MSNGILINNKVPLNFIINGRPVSAIIINDANLWPPIDNIDLDISTVLSCFGTGIWIDDFIWNDNAIWI